MEIFLKHEEVVDLLPPTDYAFYGETTVFSVLFTGAILANVPLVLIYIRSKHIRSVADRFLANMLIANMLCVLVLLPSILLDLLLPERQGVEVQITREMTRDSIEFPRVSLFGNGTLVNSTHQHFPEVITEFDFVERSNVLLVTEGGSWSCSFKKSLLAGVSTASMLAALEIAVEQYLAVVNPLHYHEFVTRNGVLTFSVIGNVVALASAILSSFDPCQPVFPGCVRNSVFYSDSLWWPVYTLAHVACFFVLPVFLMIFIYVRIWWEARRQRAKMSVNPFFVNAPAYGSGQGGSHPHNTGKGNTGFYLHPILLKFKLIDRLVAPRMDRAARVAVCTLLVSICCWGPYNFVEASHALTSVVRQMSGNTHVREDWNHYETILPLFFASLHPILSPFFYAYRYKRLREEVIKACHLKVLCCYHKNCGGLATKPTLVDFHDAPGHSESKSPHLTLSASSSDVGLHKSGLPSLPYPSPPPTPIQPKFHIGPDSDGEAELHPNNHGSVTDPSPLTDVVVVAHGSSTALSIASTAPYPMAVQHPSPSFISSVVQVVSLWWSSYSKRWSLHRESVTSNSSVVTLVSPRSRLSVTATHV